MFLFYFAFVLLFFGFVYHFLTRKYLNPYKLYMVFGKKGCGKSTLLHKVGIQALRKGKTVYSTEYIPGAYHISIDDLGVYEFEPNSVILADEVGMKWDNRHFKEFKDFHRDFFKLMRHSKLEVWLFTQVYNETDLKIRSLVDSLYMCRRVLRVFSVARKIDRTVVLNNSTAESPSSIDENFQFVPFFLPGAVKITFIPKWTKYFDSFELPPLKYKVFEHVPALDCQKPVKERIKNWCSQTDALSDEEFTDIENDVQHNLTSEDLDLLHSPTPLFNCNTEN